MIKILLLVMAIKSIADGGYESCKTIENDIERLACYDSVASATDSAVEPGPPLLEAHCQKMLESEPKSPSSLRIHSVSSSPSSESLLRVVPANRIAEGQSAKAIGETIMITYDAQNSYGAMLRGTIMCDYVSPPLVKTSPPIVYARWVSMGAAGQQDFWLHPTVSLNSLTASVQLGKRLRDYVAEQSSSPEN